MSSGNSTQGKCGWPATGWVRNARTCDVRGISRTPSRFMNSGISTPTRIAIGARMRSPAALLAIIQNDVRAIAKLCRARVAKPKVCFATTTGAPPVRSGAWLGVTAWRRALRRRAPDRCSKRKRQCVKMSTASAMPTHIRAFASITGSRPTRRVFFSIGVHLPVRSPITKKWVGSSSAPSVQRWRRFATAPAPKLMKKSTTLPR